jgi:transposase
MREKGGELRAEDEDRRAHWTLDALTEQAQQKGIKIKRSQVRRILLAEGVRWRSVRSWAKSTDPEFEKKEQPS